MVYNKSILFALLIMERSYASPLKRDESSQSIIVTPIFFDPNDITTAINDKTIPSFYYINKLNGQDSLNEKKEEGSHLLHLKKRNIEKPTEKEEADDLEMAAGTNVLRPLFVYRQQVAYRQRARDSFRRGNRL